MAVRRETNALDLIKHPELDYAKLIAMPALGPGVDDAKVAEQVEIGVKYADYLERQRGWKARLPVGSQGGPMTYVSPKTGRQCVVVTAGGARQSPDRGDYVIAYTLPEWR